MSSYGSNFGNWRECRDCRECGDYGDCDREKEESFSFRSKESGFRTAVVYIIIVVALIFYVMKYTGLSNIHPIIKTVVGFRDVLLVAAAVIMVIW